MNRQTALYQEYQLKSIRDDSKTNMKLLRYQATTGGKYIEHLKEAMNCQIKTGRNRFILIADNTPCGYQAATMLIGRIIQQDMKTELPIPYEDEFEQELNELLLDFEDPVEYEEKTYDMGRDILIGNANVFASGSLGFEQQDPFTLQRQMTAIDKISKASNLLLHCNPNVQDKEEVIEGIVSLLDQRGNIFLLIPKNGVSSCFVEHLVFQYEFKVLFIKAPSLTQLHSLFLDLASEAGLTIKQDVDIKEVIQRLKLYRNKNFWEKDLELLIAATKEKVENGRQVGREELKPYYYNGEEKPGEEQLMELIGQEEVKKAILSVTALMKYKLKQREKNENNEKFYHHLCFAGPPGTGKTEFARITARIFSMCGLSNGKYKEVSKESLTAPYLGQTSPMIDKLFQEVSGGVLFIDEAGSLVTDDRDSYTKEAISALVRHMENEPDTTVIMATYSDEMERLLSSDPGLRSRITRVIQFQPYSKEELWKIFCYMAKKEHLYVDEDAKAEVYNYISVCSSNNKDFGNAREMRKLLQAAEAELAERNINSEVISKQDVKNAGDGLLGSGVYRLPSIGFAIPVSR